MSETSLPPSIILAPDPKSVFTQPEFGTKYVFPLLSFELSDVFDDLSGPLHFIDPIEPYDGYIGGFTKQHHSYYCRENWISFKVKGGLYSFEGPEEYFAKAYWKTHDVPESVHISVRDGWKKAVDDFYVERTAKFIKWRAALSNDMGANLRIHGVRLDNFGGQPWDANWVHTVDFPMVAQDGVMDLDGEPFANTFHYPLTEDGRRFRYIGFVEAFDWRCAIHLFFDPVEQRALQTFDWT